MSRKQARSYKGVGERMRAVRFDQSVTQDSLNPLVAYLGSINLTLLILSHQGEVNVDVKDGYAAQKLANWFDERWNNKWCLDISAELIQIIEQSWARGILPTHVPHLLR